MNRGQSFGSFQKAEQRQLTGQLLAKLRRDFPDAAPDKGSRYPILIGYDDDTAERHIIGFPRRISEGGAAEPHIEIGKYYLNPIDSLPSDYDATKTIGLRRILWYIKLPGFGELLNMFERVYP